MAYDIGPRVSIQGEAEFNAAVKQMEKNFRALTAEMNLATAQFAKNDKSAAALTAQNQVLNKQIDEQNKKVPLLTAQYEKQQAKLADLAKKLEEASKEFGENSKEVSKAQAAFDRQAATVTDLKGKITQTNASIAEMTRTVNQNAESIKLQTSTFGKLGETLEKQQKGIENAGKALSAASAAILAGAAASAKAAIDWESAFAGVKKTVDATEEEYEHLANSIRQMSKEIPAAANDIALIAEKAGQLGIKTENIMGFTRAMADLGVSTNLSGEQAAQTFAQLANITGMAQTDFDRLGSSIVALGNNLATTEADISNMAQRLAAAATQAGFSESEILGLAAALSSVGLEAQAGGSAFSKAINMMTVAVETGAPELEAFGRIAGMSAKEFADAYKKDAAGAVIAFTEGLSNMERHGKSAVVLLEELDLTEVRLRDSLTRAANSGDLFRDAIELSNTAWAENLALTKEAEQRYSTTASQIQIAKNSITDAAVTIGQDFLPIIVKAAQGVKDFAGWFVSLDDTTKGFILNTLKFTAVAGPLLLVFSKGIKIYSDVKKAIEAAETAQKALNIAMTSGVWAIAAVGASALVAGIVAIVQKSKEATKEIRELNESVKSLAGDIEASNKAFGERSASIEGEVRAAREHVKIIEEQLKAIDALADKENESAIEKAKMAQYVKELNELMPGLNLQYDAEANALNMSTEAIAGYIDKKRELLAVEAAEEQIREDMKALIKNETLLAEAREKAAVAAEAQTKAEEELAEAQANTALTGANKAKYLGDYYVEADKAKRAVEALKKTEESLVEQGDALRQSIDATRDVAAKMAAGFATTSDEAESAADGLDDVARSTEVATLTAEDMDKRLADLQGSYKTLNGVLTDLVNGQDVSASQMLDLIRTYPELAGSIGMVDGALRLEERAVRDLITAQIDAEITVLDSQLRQEEAVINATSRKIQAIIDETGALELLGRAYRDSAQDADAKKFAEENITRINAQKAALVALKNEAGKVAEKTTKAAKSVAKTAEKAADPYKEAVAEIEHIHKMGQLSDEEYYKELAKNRDEFLEVNSAEWKSVTEKLYSWEQQQQKARLGEYEEMNRQLGIQYKYGLIDQDTYLSEMARLREEYFEENTENWEKSAETMNKIQSDMSKEALGQQITLLDELRNEWQKELDSLMSDYDNMVSKLQGYGELFKIEDDIMNLENLNDQAKTLEKYGAALEKLEEMEIPQGLLDEILGMDIDTGLRYAQKLISMNSQQWKAYTDAWEEKQEKAKEIADRFFKDELDSLNEKFIGKLPDELSGLKDEMRDVGVLSAEGLALGFASQADWMAKTFNDALDLVIAKVKAEQEIHSPSKLWARLGGYMAEGLGDGFDDEIEEAKRKMAQSMPVGFDINSSARQMGESAVAAIGSMLAAQPGAGNIEVKVYLNRDGLARDLVEPLAIEVGRRG